MKALISVDRWFTKLFQSLPARFARSFIGAMLALAFFAIPDLARGDQIFAAVNNGFDGLSAIGEYSTGGDGSEAQPHHKLVFAAPDGRLRN
jgi:hypothetical protein